MAWLIVAAVVALLAGLLFARIGVHVTYEDGFIFKFRYLFFTLRMKPGENGKNKKMKKRKKAGAPAKQRKAPGISEFLDLYRRFAGYAKSAAKAALSKIRVDTFRVRLVIHDRDAAKTAIRYGQACAVILPAAAFLRGAFDIRKFEAKITPQFDGGGETVFFDAAASARAGSLLWIGLSQAAKLLKDIIKENLLKKPVKDGV